MRFWLLVAAAATTLSVSAAGAEPLNFSPKLFGDRFNETAMHLGFDTRLALARCQDGGSPCVFRAATDIYCYAVARRSKNVEEVTCILGSKDAFIDWIEVMTLLPAMFSPDAAPEERGVAIKSLMHDVTSAPDHKGQFLLRGVKYSMISGTG